MPSKEFTPDPKLQETATRSAELCVKFIGHKFGKTADYSEAFLSEIENILGLLHASMPVFKPSEDDLEQFSAMLGSYLGETYRRNRGGEWGVSDDNTPTLDFGGGYRSYPWASVYNRLVNGDEDNVHHWYMGMIQYANGSPSSTTCAAPPPLPSATPPKSPDRKGFFSRLFGG